MRASIVLAIGVLGGATTFGLLSWLRDAPPSRTRPLPVTQAAAPSPESRRDARSAELQAQINQLAVSMAALRAEHESHAPAAPSAVDAQFTAPSVGPDLEARAKSDAEHQDRIADLDVAFHEEPHDPHWSLATEGTIRTAVTGAKLAQGKLQEVKCQSNTCRCEFDVVDAVKFSQEMPVLMASLAENLHGSAMNFVDNPRGGQTGIVYLFR